MDNYSERLVKGRVGSDAFIMVAAGVILAAGGVAMTVLLTSFGLFFLAGGIFIIVQAVQRFNVEYEYLILNGDIDIAKIISKKSRKNLRSISAENIQYMAALTNEYAKNDLDIKKQLKIFNYTDGTPDKDSYYVVFENKNGKEAAYILDLDQKSLDIMKDALKMKFRK